MNCKRYKDLHARFTDFPVPKEVWDTPEFEKWHDHRHHCTSCSDWSMQQTVVQRGVSPEDFPCIHMAYFSSHKCEEHPDPRKCTKSVILRIPKFDEYFISPRGATGDDVTITHCPWCGTALPESKRDLWFERIKALGLDPCGGKVPKNYQSDKWYRKPNKP